MMKKWLGLLLLGVSVNVWAVAPNTDLCNKFVPQNNKIFIDTYNVDTITLSRTGKNKIAGRIKHKFLNNTQYEATITAASCNGNQVAFSWNLNKNFYGSFSGTLQCYNNIYNIVGVLIDINGQGSYIPAMQSAASGPCPG